MEEYVYLRSEEEHRLISNKLMKAGLSEEHANTVADHLVYADERGINSHGAMRVEYYAERIAKGGINTSPKFEFTKTGVCTGIYDGDNGAGFVVAKNAMEIAIDIAKENGIACVGMRRMSHCGTLSYYLRMAGEAGLLAMSMCQSDPMVVPYGGTQAYFGTNPIGFAAPVKGANPIIFDMATTVGAWGKILDARSKNHSIPSDWAVNDKGLPTTDPFDVSGLLPIAGAKGYGLMMMVDVLSGMLNGAPSGPDVSSMYDNLSSGRELGQLHIVINPAFFCGAERFDESIKLMAERLNAAPAAEGNDTGVLCPGQREDNKAKCSKESGIPIVKSIYDYLVSDVIHNNRYECGNPFAVAKED